MNIPVFVDKVFQEYISIKKTTTIRSIKKFLEKYKGDIKFFVDYKTTSKFFDTDKYDKYNLSSIWNQLKQPSIEISSEDQFKYTSKDMVFKIMDEMDDFTLLNFCKINNQRDSEGVLYCNNEKFWENRLLRKYPLLIKFKGENESWKEFYLEMVYYLSKLEENFGIPYIPYIPTRYYNPKRFYKKFKDSEDIFNEAMIWAVKGGHVDIVELIIEKGANDFNRAIKGAAG